MIIEFKGYDIGQFKIVIGDNMAYRGEISGISVDDYNSLVMEVKTNIKLSDVILSDENKAQIDEFIEEYVNRDKLIKYGLTPMNKLLFYGDSGCGKTFLGKALTRYLNYGMLYVDIAQALSRGDVAENIAKVFKIGNMGKYVIFLDECDSIAWNREKGNDGGIVRRATNSLFQCMDQMGSELVMIAATNMLHKLDPAFERRFHLKLEFCRPDVTNLGELVKRFMKPEFKFEYGVRQEQIERRCELSYYEIQSIVEREMKKAVIRGDMTIRMKDIYEDIARFKKFKIQYVF